MNKINLFQCKTLHSVYYKINVLYQRADSRTARSTSVTTTSDEIRAEQPSADMQLIGAADAPELLTSLEGKGQDTDSTVTYQQQPPVTTVHTIDDVIIAPVSISAAPDEVVITVFNSNVYA